MDREIVDEIRAANEACMSLLTLMTLDDNGESAARLVAEDPMYGQPTTCMALAAFAMAAANALAEQLEIPIEAIIQNAATNAAMHTIKLEEILNEEDEEP